MKNKTTGLILILVSAITVGVGGYFVYKFIKDDNFGSDNNKHIEYPMNLDIPDYIPNAKKDIPTYKANDDPNSYKRIMSDDLRFTYEDISLASGLEGMIPSHGNPNILLVPVEFEDLAKREKMVWDERMMLSLNGAFNGTNDDCTNSYNESVRSFYRKSSYGNLDLNFILTDPFTPSIYSDEFVSLENSSDGGGTYKILEDFYKKGTINGHKINFNDSMFDINHDGFVDGVWLIYNEKRTANRYQQRYWPYCFWYVPEKNTDPNFSAYANCSVNFTYIDSNQGLDAHTITHETGHMLGLDDYYSYDFVGSKPAAMGGLDMMDFNIGEHNCFSKTALGWTNPVVPLKPGTFKLRPFESSGDCLILSNDFNDSAFSEYIILEYYTPTGLNHFDSTFEYNGRPKYFDKPGIRAFHVDARLVEMKANIQTGESVPQGYIPSTQEELEELTTLTPYFYLVGHSNTRTRNIYSTNKNTIEEDLISVISKDNMQIYKRNPATNSSIFGVGDKFIPFIYRKYFGNSDFLDCKFDDGSINNFEFEVLTMTPNEVTISIDF